MKVSVVISIYFTEQILSFDIIQNKGCCKIRLCLISNTQNMIFIRNGLYISGKWFVTMKTGMKDSVLSYFTEIYDGKVVFKTNLAGGFDIKAGEYYDNDTSRQN